MTIQNSIYNKNVLSYRKINVFLLVMSVTSMAFALLFLQKYLGLSPCPLCVLQRIGMIVLGIFSLLAVVINPKKRLLQIILWLGGVLGTLWSAGVAAWHVYIQHLPPDKVPSCGPGLDYWLDTLPWQQVLKEIFSGSGECAVISWRFLGLSIPEQALIVFVFLLMVQAILLKRIL